MGLKRFFSKFLGLANVVVEDVEWGALLFARQLTVKLRPAWRRPRCGTCGRKAKRLHGLVGKKRSWRHLGPFGVRLTLSCDVFRVLCRSCGVKTMSVPWARTGSVFTRAFEDEVAWFVQRTTKDATAKYFRLTWATVGRIAKRVVEEKLDGKLLRNLRLIGVDEISYGRPQKYLTVVVDHERGRVIWSAEGQSAATLGRFFSEIGAQERRRIEVVSMDMDSAFEKAVREWVPNAKIVFDRFHVVQLLGKAVDEVRREQARSLESEERSDLKRSRFALLKNPWNLTRREKEKLSIVATTNRPTYRAYLLKEGFQEIYDAPTPEEADTAFREWYGWARRSKLDPFRRVAETLKSKWEGVRRFLECGLTNGPVEGWNSKIRMISHRAFGFHSAEALVAMIMLCCSGIVIDPLGYA